MTAVLSLLTIAVFGSWAGAAVLNLLAIFVFGVWIGERNPGEGTVLAPGGLEIWGTSTGKQFGAGVIGQETGTTFTVVAITVHCAWYYSIQANMRQSWMAPQDHSVR